MLNRNLKRSRMTEEDSKERSNSPTSAQGIVHPHLHISQHYHPKVYIQVPQKECTLA